MPCFSQEINVEFFNSFNDCYLPKYVSLAIAKNHSLKEIQYKVEEYKRQEQMSFGKELPILSMNASYLGFNVPKLDNFSLSQNSFILPFIFAYEPDLLLKNRDKTKSVKKAYEAIKEQEKWIQLTLVGEVATAYINILQYDNLIKNQTEIVKNEEEQLQKIKLLYKYGISNIDEVRSKSQILENEKNNLENLISERETVLNNFTVLIGLSPDKIDGIERANIEKFNYNKQLPKNIESEIIFKRPDIANIEKQMEKADIDIKIARKEFFPTFGITGLWVFNTISHKNFFSWDNSIVSLMAGATQDLFRGGVKLANLRIKKAKYEQLFERYTQNGLDALKEVNTSLCLINADTKIDERVQQQLNSENEKYTNTERKYEKGIISDLDKIKEKEKILKLTQNKTKAKSRKLADYITLYKAVGGDL